MNAVIVMLPHCSMLRIHQEEAVASGREDTRHLDVVLFVSQVPCCKLFFQKSLSIRSTVSDIVRYSELCLRVLMSCPIATSPTIVDFFSLQPCYLFYTSYTAIFSCMPMKMMI